MSLVLRLGAEDRSACRSGTRIGSGRGRRHSVWGFPGSWRRDIRRFHWRYYRRARRLISAPGESARGATSSTRGRSTRGGETRGWWPGFRIGTSWSCACRIPRGRAAHSRAESEIQKFVEDAELLQEPASVPEHVAEVSGVLLPSTTAEMVPLLPEPQLDIGESASSTVEIPPSSVEEITLAPAPVASNASNPLDALEPAADETASL